MYNKLKYTFVMQDIDKAIYKIASKLESKLNDTITILNKTRDKIESSFFETVYSTIVPCGFEENDKQLFNLSVENYNTSNEILLTLQQGMYIIIKINYSREEQTVFGLLDAKFVDSKV